MLYLECWLCVFPLLSRDLTRAGSVLWHNWCVLERNSTFYSSDAISLDVSTGLLRPRCSWCWCWCWGWVQVQENLWRRICSAAAASTTVPRYHATWVEVYYPEFLDRADFFSGNDDIADCNNSHAIFRFISHTLDELLLFRRHKRPNEIKCRFHLLTLIIHISHCRM